MCYNNLRWRGVAQFGRALRSGRRGRRFKSCRIDWLKTLKIKGFEPFFVVWKDRKFT